jgi:GT2 family glycosyltransferase
MPITAVVILNFNGKKYLEKFLPTLIQFTNTAEIIIIDNASTDDSLEWLGENYPNLKTIILDKNYGFAGGYQLGLQKIEADFFVLLNSDIEVTKDWLLPLTDFLEKNENVAAVQPKILSYHQKDYFEYAGASGGFLDKFCYPFCRGRIFDTLEKDENQYENIEKVFWATGACLVIKKEAYWKARGLDVDFFAHFEEIDLCWRLQNVNYEIFCIPESKVYHVGGGTLAQESSFKTFLNFRNNLILITKNHPSFLWILIVRFFLDMLAVGLHLKKGKFKNSWAIIKAYFQFYWAFFHHYKKRKLLPRKKTKNLKGFFHQSIAWKYFIQNKKKWNEIYTNFKKK